MKIEIEILSDSNECETCGGNWAEGGVVYIDGKEVLRREPVAYCYGAPSYNEDALLVMALKKIGIDVFVDNERYFISSYDPEYHKSELSESDESVQFEIESLDPDERSWYYDGDGTKRKKE